MALAASSRTKRTYASTAIRRWKDAGERRDISRSSLSPTRRLSQRAAAFAAFAIVIDDAAPFATDIGSRQRAIRPASFIDHRLIIVKG